MIDKARNLGLWCRSVSEQMALNDADCQQLWYSNGSFFILGLAILIPILFWLYRRK